MARESPQGGVLFYHLGGLLQLRLLVWTVVGEALKELTLIDLVTDDEAMVLSW